jgi:uncharacterized protein (DUF1501 family)
MELFLERLKSLTRRHFLKTCNSGLGALALSSLIGDDRLVAGAASASSPLAPKAPHFPAKARRVIYLHMAGSPSQLDLFDNKPKLIELNGQPCPDSYLNGERFAFIKGVPKLLGSPHRFTRHGQGGVELSALLPNLATVADELTVIRSMVTDQFNHAPAQIFLNTGSPRMGRPSMGAWLTYGLGSESQNLPGYVVLLSGPNGPDGGVSCWGSGFIPSVYQGVQFRSQGDPVLYVSNPKGINRDARRESLDALNDLNRLQSQEIGDPETVTRIEQYEMAYRMQTSVPELMDLSQEPQHIHEMYGTQPGKVAFANNALLARRLVERGVRFVQLFHWGWDSHGVNQDTDIVSGLEDKCQQTEKACAALIKDLKQRGLLDSTLIVWGGEFGRTPMNEERNGSKFLGRDHHPHAFSVWLAGGGVKQGYTHGLTDELGYKVAEGKVHVHDLQATILHLMGLEHTQLTYRFQGRDYRLTDVHGNVIHQILA